jgi:hypothetical protein
MRRIAISMRKLRIRSCIAFNGRNMPCDVKIENIMFRNS